MSLPLISCILPTYNRYEYLFKAINNFLRQTYPNKELIILDDTPKLGKISIPSNRITDNSIRYIHEEKRRTISAKRNILCSEAKGDIIAHYDDDDWSDPHRLQYQYDRIDKLNVLGFNRVYFYDTRVDKAYRYYYTPNFIVGATLMYTKDIWSKIKFNELFTEGSDDQFCTDCRTKGYKAIDGGNLFVAMTTAKSLHKNKHFENSVYTPISKNALPQGFIKYLGLLTEGVSTEPTNVLESPVGSR